VTHRADRAVVRRRGETRRSALPHIGSSDATSQPPAFSNHLGSAHVADCDMADIFALNADRSAGRHLRLGQKIGAAFTGRLSRVCPPLRSGGRFS